eukprot:GHVU01000655.1.p2 GENE.GHVU01000655.1~~GHVU01000655.1.p2  ORF type:complete len:100 (+),score=6.43 GHVU01000655.1:60-359(+)
MACVITQQGEVDKARNISEAKKIVEEAVRSVTSGDLSLWTRGANGEADILHPLTKLGLDASTWAAAIAYARQEGGSKGRNCHVRDASTNPHAHACIYGS